MSGLHRKHAMRLLRAGQRDQRSGLRPTRRLYDEAVREALIVIWKASDRVCGKRLGHWCRSWSRRWNGTDIFSSRRRSARVADDGCRYDRPGNARPAREHSWMRQYGHHPDCRATDVRRSIYPTLYGRLHRPMCDVSDRMHQIMLIDFHAARSRPRLNELPLARQQRSGT